MRWLIWNLQSSIAVLKVCAAVLPGCITYRRIPESESTRGSRPHLPALLHEAVCILSLMPSRRGTPGHRNLFEICRHMQSLILLVDTKRKRPRCVAGSYHSLNGWVSNPNRMSTSRESNYCNALCSTRPDNILTLFAVFTWASSKVHSKSLVRKQKTSGELIFNHSLKQVPAFYGCDFWASF